ncbi:MAG: hypothetical protein K6T28_06530 [Acidothermus sp.]|nr:hypothetical protein [Acidothermus sp.]
MKVFLMFPDRDFDAAAPSPPLADDLVNDLELETLLLALSSGDEFLFAVARTALLETLPDPALVRYRQDIVRDCLRNEETVRALYDLSMEAIRAEKQVWRAFWNSPEIILNRSLQVMEAFLDFLRKLRTQADRCADQFESAGFRRFFRMIRTELGDEYLATVAEHLKALHFRRGVFISARLGVGNKGAEYVLRKAPERGWLGRLTSGEHGRESFSFQIADRDEAGMRALNELRGRGLNPVADALATAADHVLAFFRALRTELAFYIGCLNLVKRLESIGMPWSLPEVLPSSAGPTFRATKLYDVCLALKVEDKVVANDVEADGKRLIVVTGANQGGKSTFLRSVGLAHLMAQCGMVVPCASLRLDARTRVFTHFKREEDPSMRGGKLDEELARMSAIVDHIGTGGLLLCNESFGSTNEREGSEIARQVVTALVDGGVKVVYVTHLFDLADSLTRDSTDDRLFLRAERLPDGRRTFRLVPGMPEPTSHGEDSYRRIFGVEELDRSSSGGL